VTKAEEWKSGDIRLDLSGGYAILVFLASSRSEAWRLFAPGSDQHLVFPTAARDLAITRRKAPRVEGEWEAWLRVVEPRKDGTAMQAPPPVILAADGTRYRCGRCGRVLAIAEFGSLRDFVIHCRECGYYNEVGI
jgi:DNA-directed RNA polymerase subunit RPC12/RpoP